MTKKQAGLPKIIILVRHGQTGLPSSHGERHILERSASLLGERSRQIRPYCTGNVGIFSSNLARACESAAIIGKTMGCGPESVGLRLRNINNLGKIFDQQRNKKPVNIYLEINSRKISYLGVETASHFVNRVLDLLRSHFFDTAILVSHEVSLEAFLYNVHGYKIVRKNFRKFFDYADFAVLRKLD